MARPKKTSEKNRPSTSEKIMEEAKALFRERGYDGVSMRDITVACDITKPTLYYHFVDKETLYTEVLIRMMENGYHHHRPYSAKVKDLREGLIRITEGFIENAPTSLMAMVRDSSTNVSETAWQKIQQALQLYVMTPFESIFKQAQEEGVIQKSSASELTVAFLSLIDGYKVCRECLPRESGQVSDESEWLVDLFLSGAALKK